MKIKTLTIVTAQGVKVYDTTDKYEQIHLIEEDFSITEGKPQIGYIGKDKTGNVLLRVSHNVPVVVDYTY